MEYRESSDKLKAIIRPLFRPFREHLGLFLTVFYCSIAALVIFDYMNGCPIRTIKYFIKIGFVISYFTVFVAGLFKGKAYLTAKIILLVLSILNLATDSIVELTSGSRFNDSVYDLICQTNISESQEFFKSYITLKVLMITVSLVIAPFILRHLWKYINRIPKIIGPYIFMPFLVYCCIFTEFKTTVSPSVFLLKSHYLFNPVEYIDLKEFEHEPTLLLSQDSVQNIVIIIGESMTKSHCSLYSYEKDTYPNLAALKPIVFKNVTAPDRSTNGAFKCILNTHKVSDNSGKWYESTTIFDIAKARSYKTTWLSNQMRYGLTANVVTDFAVLADSSKWVVEIDNYASKLAKHLDENLLPHLIKFGREKNIEIIHLMGSHEEFSARYPASFDRFKEEDYLKLPAHQRKKLAQYDNSLLYNDYIVSEIIKKYRDDDVVIFYFPDHGLDLYESSDSFCGHAHINNAKSCKFATDIPFLVFYSDLFSTEHPNLLKSLYSKIDNHFCTDTFIYLASEVMGIDAIDGIDVSLGLE